MFHVCCGGGRDDNDADRSAITKFKDRQRGELAWLSEAGSEGSNSPWQEQDKGVPSTTRDDNDNDPRFNAEMTIRILRAKRLRSGYTNVHFLCPFVKVFLANTSNRTDGQLLCKTQVARSHKQEDAVSWNYETTIKCSKEKIVANDTVLRFEIVDAEDWDMSVQREFQGQDLRDLISTDKTIKKTVKLPNGGGIPARSGKRPSIHVGVTVTPNPYFEYEGVNLVETPKSTSSTSNYSRPPSRHSSPLSSASLSSNTTDTKNRKQHKTNPLRNSPLTQNNISQEIRNWGTCQLSGSSSNNSPQRTMHKQMAMDVRSSVNSLEDAFNAITADAPSNDSDDGNGKNEEMVKARQVFNALGEGMRRFEYINDSAAQRVAPVAAPTASIVEMEKKPEVSTVPAKPKEKKRKNEKKRKKEKQEKQEQQEKQERQENKEKKNQQEPRIDLVQQMEEQVQQLIKDTKLNYSAMKSSEKFSWFNIFASPDAALKKIYETSVYERDVLATKLSTLKENRSKNLKHQAILAQVPTVHDYNNATHWMEHHTALCIQDGEEQEKGEKKKNILDYYYIEQTIAKRKEYLATENQNYEEENEEFSSANTQVVEVEMLDSNSIEEGIYVTNVKCTTKGQLPIENFFYTYTATDLVNKQGTARWLEGSRNFF